MGYNSERCRDLEEKLEAIRKAIAQYMLMMTAHADGEVKEERKMK